MPTFVVVRVNGDASDTHAAEHRGDRRAALEAAIDLAMPDDGAALSWCAVTASDAGAARVLAMNLRGVSTHDGWAGWVDLDPETLEPVAVHA